MPDARDDYGDCILDAERAAAAGDFARAEAALRQAHDLQEARLGAAHPELASTLNNLAVVCETNGRLDDAERFYRRAFAVASAALRPGDSLVETSRANLEDFCRAHGRAVDDWPELSHRPASAVAAPTEPPVAPLTPVAPSTPAPPSDRTPDPTPRSVRPAAPPLASTSRPRAASAGPASPPRGFVAALLTLALAGTLAIAWFAFGPADAPPPTTAATPATVTPEAPEPPAAAANAPPPEAASPQAATPVPLSPGAPSALPPAVPSVTPSPAAGGEVRAARPTPEAEPVEPASTPDGAATRLIEADVCARFTRQGRQWTCAPAGGAVSPGAVTFYTRVATARAARIEHRWYRNDELARTITLSVGASESEGYRTFSQQTVSPGRWRVEARTSDGRVLGEAHFDVRD